ncbi:MAG: hypothetical protein R3212_05750 [Xanthomonadales bacterium]|nr:hypothetical protein [Xanthomonadales bacterium]
MSNQSTPGAFEPPSRKKILVGSGIALVVAIIVLVAVIWPAEYGRDPTGIGGLLGITGMSSGAGPTQVIELVDVVGGNEVLREVEIPDFGEPTPLPNPNVFQSENSPPETIRMSLELASGAETEVKMVMTEGKVAVYDWQVDDGIIYSQFHGHTPEFGDEFWVEYKEDQQGAAGGQGSLVAPFSGEHGWYWVNLEDHPVTITVTVTGYVDDLVDYSEMF